MEFRRKPRSKPESGNLKRTLKGVSSRHRLTICMVVFIGSLCTFIAIWFGTSALSDPDFDMASIYEDARQVDKYLSVNSKTVVGEDFEDAEEEDVGQDNQGVSGPHLTNTDRGPMLADYPIALFAVSITGEGTGSRTGFMGDDGQAYGLMQLDYRYALMDFIQWSVVAYPDLWGGLAPFVGCSKGDSVLRGNPQILQAFEDACNTDGLLFTTTQFEFFKLNFYDPTYQALMAAGINLDERHIAVSSAILSLQVNAGARPSKIVSILNPSMTDEEIIRTLYANRRSGFIKSGGREDQRWTTPCEEQQCIDLLTDVWTIEQDYPQARTWSAGWFWSIIGPIYFGV